MPDAPLQQPETNPADQTKPPPPPPAGPPALVKISIGKSGTPTFCLVNRPHGVSFDGETFVVTQEVRFKFFFWNRGYTPTGVTFNQTAPTSRPDPQGQRNMIDRKPDSDPSEPGKPMYGVTDAHHDGTKAAPWVWKLIIDYTDDQNQQHRIDPEIANTDGFLLPKFPPP